MNDNFDETVSSEDLMLSERRGRRVAWEDSVPQGTLDISPPNMFQYIESWKQGGQTVVALSADGFFHLASALHLSITECKVREDSTNETWLGDAVAMNETTGQTVCGHSEESFRTSNGRPNHGARAKASTKAQRNALKKLIPRALISEIISTYEASKGKPVVSPLEAAKATARTAVQSARPVIERMGLTMDEIYEAFQEEKSIDDWDASDYRRLAAALRTPRVGRIRELADAKSEQSHIVEPEDVDEDVPENGEENGDKPF